MNEKMNGRRRGRRSLKRVNAKTKRRQRTIRKIIKKKPPVKKLMKISLDQRRKSRKSMM